MNDLQALKREARKRGTPPERLLELARMGPPVSRAVATSRHVSPGLLVELAYSEDWVTRARVSHHRKTPLFILDKLANDKESGVLRNLLTHPRLPEHICRNLMQCQDATVSRRAFSVALYKGYAAHSEVLAAIDDNNFPFRQRIVFWRDLSVEEALELLKDPHEWVRGVILARQLRTRPLRKRRRRARGRLLQPLPLEAILPLLDDPEPEVRQLAAQIVDRMTQLQEGGAR
ncbi:hypothetical protein ACFP81_13830 [Deinococcus lacus]|uniref:HEAT repeat domain-containing protein n=1 Tax=Deinococcus lacus TaxID=392561 RepID=A0ABW1YHN8_9DEIO